MVVLKRWNGRSVGDKKERRDVGGKQANDQKKS
jgi:hypothetical protein